MNYNPFEQLNTWLNKNSLTQNEKRAMKERLMVYATNHPVKSGLISPYTFRYASVAFASLVLVLGGSIGITNASANALPNQSLYGIKLWIEEVRAVSQKTPAEKITFETNRITTRFDEAATLAVQGKLTDASSEIIQSGLEHSRNAIKATADSIQETDPELALMATNNLETAFSSNGKILATIEKTTNQHLGSIVLAAQVTTEKLALEKVKFEKIVSLKPNITTKASAETKLADLTEKIKISSPEVVDPSSAVTSAAIPAEPATVIPTVSNIPVAQNSVDSTEKTSIKQDANSLLTEAKRKVKEGSYSEAVVSLQKAQQVLDEATLTKKLETTYNIKTELPPPTPPESTSKQ